MDPLWAHLRKKPQVVSIIFLLVIGCGLIAVGITCLVLSLSLDFPNDDEAVLSGWMVCLGFSASGIFVVWIAVNTAFRKQYSPLPEFFHDYLNSRQEVVFDCNGIEFTILGIPSSGTNQVTIYFQNRYLGDALVELKFHFLKIDQRCWLQFSCPGGGVGVVCGTIGVPAPFHEMPLEALISGTVQFSPDRGPMARPDRGTTVPTCKSRNTATFAALALMIAGGGLIVGNLGKDRRPSWLYTVHHGPDMDFEAKFEDAVITWQPTTLLLS